MLIVADGASGLIKAIEHCWRASDRQHCAVHRVRNLLAKLPDRERERVRQVFWQAPDDATDERDAKQRLLALVGELNEAGYTAAARAWATTSTRSSSTCATRPDTAGDGGRRTCSSDRSARSNAGPR